MGAMLAEEALGSKMPRPAVYAGRYRRENVAISGASTTPPDFLHVPEQMQLLQDWYAGTTGMNPIARAAELHTRFVEIHPFVVSVLMIVRDVTGAQ